jgi:hypothetical protein
VARKSKTARRFALLFRPLQIGTIMHISTLLAILGAAALSAPAVAGPAALTPDAGSTAMAAVQTGIQGRHHALRSGDVADVVGSYDLSNGQTLRVSFAQRKLFAEMGGSKTEIVPAGQRTFVSHNEDTKLVFDQLPFGNRVAVTRK